MDSSLYSLTPHAYTHTHPERLLGPITAADDDSVRTSHGADVFQPGSTTDGDGGHRKVLNRWKFTGLINKLSLRMRHVPPDPHLVLHQSCERPFFRSILCHSWKSTSVTNDINDTALFCSSVKLVPHAARHKAARQVILEFLVKDQRQSCSCHHSVWIVLLAELNEAAVIQDLTFSMKFGESQERHGLCEANLFPSRYSDINCWTFFSLTVY